MKSNRLNIGITGGEGTLGKIATTKLRAYGFIVDLFNGDVRSEADLDQWLKDSTIDILLHFAAIVPIEDVVNQPELAFEVNANGTRKLFNVLCRYKKKIWLFYASSSHVYASKSTPIKETDPTEPITLYGKTKLAGEKFLLTNSKDFNGTVCIGRIFSFFHDTQGPSFLYSSIKKRLQTHNPEEPFELFGAKNSRDFLNAEEVVDRIIKLMKIRAKGVINIGSGKAKSIECFVQEVFKCPTLNIKNVNPDEQNILVADIAKYKQLIHDDFDA